MELHSRSFCSAVEAAMDSKKLTVAVVHRRSNHPFISEIKARKDVLIFEVTVENRDFLCEEILRDLRKFLIKR